ncbi:hypothetical protein HK097_004522 [Rhizophlyctis rosea]|uniref:Uncharacterized protein n=1 Tax=Rhizophlyctis rosea TaxID=64517 RepID=A0AAD5WWQ0_9FUNG|nr:hypothetical protein HK097_004522 [Rhizophlyctis rosea]
MSAQSSSQSSQAWFTAKSSNTSLPASSANGSSNHTQSFNAAAPLHSPTKLHKPADVLLHPEIRHNPIYTRFLSFKDLCDIVDTVIAKNKIMLYSPLVKLITKSAQTHATSSAFPPNVQYHVHFGVTVRTEQLLQTLALHEYVSFRGDGE